MRLLWVGFLFSAASVLTACGSSTVPPAPETAPQPAATPVPALTTTANPFTPSAQTLPVPTSLPVPVPTPTATRFSTPAPSQPGPTNTTVRAPTAAGSPSAPQGPADDQAEVPVSSLSLGDKRLAVIRNRDWTFIKNGGRVNLANGLSAELFLDPYPPTQLSAVLDLYLARGGQPVTDASMDVTYDMKGMVHGPFMSAARNLGNGHYLLTIKYIMFSAWEHKLVIYLPEDHYELELGTVVSPSPMP